MISTKGRYALRVMIDLAERQDGQPVPLKDIAQRQGISKKYSESIVRALVGAKLIKGSSGKGGGYRLCRTPEETPVGTILEATEGRFFSVACLAEDADACPRAGQCRTLPMWREFDAMVHDFFYHKTLGDLIRREDGRDEPAQKSRI